MHPGNEEAVRHALSGLGAQVKYGEPLARYTTYRIGGPARALVIPESEAQVSEVVRRLSECSIPWLVLGFGSNVLIRDAGFAGVVLRVDKPLSGIESQSRTKLRVGAGLPTPHLARRTAREGLAGVHRLIGVPGTVGGGVYMNAGAHGQDFASVVHSVRVVDATGEIVEIPSRGIDWQYRTSNLGRVIVTEATLELAEEDPALLKRELGQHLAWRKAGTPFSEPCCGSVFRNPGRATHRERRTAGQLIDAAGLKGYRVGGAEVSRMHANYIVNRGGARASDVLAVIETVRRRVQDEFDIELELELKLIGY